MSPHEETPAYRKLKLELLDMRNDLSFNAGGIPHGGPAREEWTQTIRCAIRDKLTALERMERDGLRYLS